MSHIFSKIVFSKHKTKQTLANEKIPTKQVVDVVVYPYSTIKSSREGKTANVVKTKLSTKAWVFEKQNIRIL